jgi:hypothetical protein
MAQPTRIVWDIPPEEHAFWLAQARCCNLSVGELIYVLASVYVLEGWPVGGVPPTAQCLHACYQRVRAARQRRLSRSEHFAQ